FQYRGRVLVMGNKCCWGGKRDGITGEVSDVRGRQWPAPRRFWVLKTCGRISRDCFGGRDDKRM
ncbi:hypothetical protein, partial [Sansalvadorimonas verongulae]|uniref:hypothetical protein n=1 Tax=Sansalvadorimonas verongulae TaxID=2172824 RepID=UPI001E3B3E66